MSAQAPLDFTDGKDPNAFRTIGEVAQAFGLRQHVLRYWEEQFPMLKPLKRAGGRRYYRPEDVRLVSEISRLLYKEGFTIRGARQALKNGGDGSVDGLAPSSPENPGAEPLTLDRPGEELEREELAAPSERSCDVARLQALRDDLADALGQA
jgi:DNA-binding transcriptional MerR regulator